MRHKPSNGPAQEPRSARHDAGDLGYRFHIWQAIGPSAALLSKRRANSLDASNNCRFRLVLRKLSVRDLRPAAEAAAAVQYAILAVGT